MYITEQKLFIELFLDSVEECIKALGHDISKRYVTKFKRIVRGPSFR